MKKIALIHYAYPPNIGGVEMLMREQAHVLADIGYEVTVLTGSGAETNPGIRVIEDSQFQSILRFNPELQGNILKGAKVFDEFNSLSHSIEEKLEVYLSDCDIIIVHNMLTLLHNLAFNDAFKRYNSKHTEKKVIIWAHDQTFIDGENILENKPGVNLSAELKSLLMTPIPRAAYVVISETFKRLFIQVMKLPEQDVLVIPNGINMKRFLEIDDSIWKLYTEKNILARFPVVLSPVNLLPRKNIEFSLDIVAQLKRVYPNILYILSGKASVHRTIGAYVQDTLEKIQKLNLSENVLFLGDLFTSGLKDSELHDLYTLSDCVFYFSKSENFGLPVLEASVSKTLIFTSKLAVFSEITGQGVTQIDITKPASESVEEIKKKIEYAHIEEASRIRRTYNLETIIKEKLVPHLL